MVRWIDLSLIPCSLASSFSLGLHCFVKAFRWVSKINRRHFWRSVQRRSLIIAKRTSESLVWLGFNITYSSAEMVKV